MHEKNYQGTNALLNYAEFPPNGPPLLLLHGLTFHWQSFRSLIPELSRKWHVYAMDFRGHGESEWSVEGYYFADLVSDTIEFIRAEINEPTVIFGHSLGAAAGLAAAAQLGTMARALIIADNFVFRDSLMEITGQPLLTSLFRAVQRIAGLRKPAKELLPILIETKLLLDGNQITVGELFAGNIEFLQGWSESIAHLDPKAVEIFFIPPPAEAFDGDTMLRAVNSPIMFLQANVDRGGILPDRDLERALSIHPECVIHRFDGLGHMMHMENAEVVLPAVLDFLESC